jgi:hypothetical protein
MTHGNHSENPPEVLLENASFFPIIRAEVIKSRSGQSKTPCNEEGKDDGKTQNRNQPANPGDHRVYY